VNLLLATFTSAVNIAFFWVIVRQAILAARTDPTINPSRVLGLVGEARTRIDPTGSVYVGGELWTARSEKPIEAGSGVQVVDREGLILTVSLEPTGTEGEA
jgi:membrane-bound serine protease (ClpP class)